MPRGGKKLTLDRFIEQAQEVHGTQYDYSTVVYQHSLKTVNIKCPLHGIWATTPNNHVHRKSGCPTCAGHISTMNIFLKRATAIHANRYDYTLFSIVNRGKEHLPIRCSIHGVFWQRALHHVRGSGCPECGYEAAGAKQLGRKRAKMTIPTI